MPFIPGFFGPSLLQIELKDHIRKMDDISKKGANSEYWNEMYLYGGKDRFNFLNKPRLKLWRRMIAFFKIGKPSL